MALSIEQCKKLLNDANYTDDQIIKVREFLSVIASNTIDSIVAERLEVGLNDVNETDRS